MEFRFTRDPLNMNWFREDYEYTKVTAPKGLAVQVAHLREEDIMKTRISLANNTALPIFAPLGSVGIYFPLPDSYEDAQTCLKSRCHAHIFCGGDISYIMALRMGGAAPHLGMVLTEGSLGAYSIERDVDKRSNDRGCFILHPSPMEILPGQSAEIKWTIFPHTGKDNFLRELKKHRSFVDVRATHYVAFQGEQNTLSIAPSFAAKRVMVNGVEIESSGNVFVCDITSAEIGEQIFEIEVDKIKTYCRIYVQLPLTALTAKRCSFIAEQQQYNGEYAPLCGAYLPYDNEDRRIYYSATDDYNGGRERVGMGILMARSLRNNEDEALHASLKRYKEYVLRELVDKDGYVYNDIEHNKKWERLYNFPWFSEFFLELYLLDGKKEDLDLAARIMQSFYNHGGCGFYAIEFPMASVYRALEQAGMETERAELKTLFTKHADCILERGLNYPPSEVNFEQSIVAPAANILLQAYIVTGEEKYLSGAEEHLNILDLFNGIQPDYRLHETAIRHWDGYWFGKRKTYGDTFPHYWSALSGVAFALYGSIKSNEAWLETARHSLRGVLPMIHSDGSGTCAHQLPLTVNGELCACDDPLANDQDWALYFSNREPDMLLN